MRWDRGAWAAGRDSVGIKNKQQLHYQVLQIHYFESDFCADLPRNCTTLVRVLLWAALVFGRRVDCPSDTFNISKSEIQPLLLTTVSAADSSTDCYV